MQTKSLEQDRMAEMMAHGLRQADTTAVGLLHAYATEIGHADPGGTSLLMLIIRELLPKERRGAVIKAWIDAEEEFERRKAAGDLDERSIVKARTGEGIERLQALLQELATSSASS